MEWVKLYLIIFVVIVCCISFGIAHRNGIINILNKYYDHPTLSNITAGEFGEELLKIAQKDDIQIVQVNGKFSNSYNPKYKVVKLSSLNLYSNSITALGICAHEVGHAICSKSSKFLYAFRFYISHVLNLASTLFIPLILLGSIIAFSIGYETVGFWIIISATILFVLCFLILCLILIFEKNTSKKVLKLVEQSEILTESELSFLKLVLNSINRTYYSIYLTSLLSFFKILDYEKIMQPSKNNEN